MTLLSFDSAQELSKVSDYINYIGEAHKLNCQNPRLHKNVFEKVSSKILFILHLLQRPAQVQVCFTIGERAPLLWARGRVLCNTRVPRTTARATKRATLVARKSLSRLASQLQCIFYFTCLIILLLDLILRLFQRTW
jgi:hypothetical protein